MDELENEREWRRYLINRFDKMETRIEAIAECNSQIKEKMGERVSKLEVKAGFWGLIGGLLVSIIAYLKTII